MLKEVLCSITNRFTDSAIFWLLRLNPFSCGYTTKFYEVNDSEGGLRVLDYRTNKFVPHDPLIHGQIDTSTWVKQGQPVPGLKWMKRLTGKTPKHDHNGDYQSGPYRFNLL